MTHFRNKNDLLNWLSEHAPNKIVRRALDRGTTTVWGLFKGGFVIEIKHLRKSYVVGIKPSKILGKHCCGLLRQVPFKDYEGGSTPLTMGDCPVLALERKKNVT